MHYLSRKYVSYFWWNEDMGKYSVETITRRGNVVRLHLSERELNSWLHNLDEFPKDELRKLVEMGIVRKGGNCAPVFEMDSPPELDVYHIEIAEACNLNCKHCYLGAPKEKSFMDLSLFQKIVDDGIEKGLKRVELTGGEPTLHPYLTEIAKYTMKKGLYTVLFTNGTVRTNPSLFDMIQISIDGLKSTHEETRGIHGIFETIVNNAKYYGRNTSVVIATTLLPNTPLWEVFQVHKMLSLPIRVGPPVPIGAAKGLSQEELKELYRRSYVFYEQMGWKTTNKFSCVAGERLFYYDVNGNVFPCPLLKGVDLDVWKKVLQSYRSTCDGCRGCLYPCPAYRFYLGKVRNPWCKMKTFSVFDSDYDEIIYSLRPLPEEDYAVGVHKIIRRFMPNAKKLLSIGCGYAVIEENLAQRYGYDITCMDRALKPYSSRESELKSKGVRYILGDAFDRRAYPKGKFDAAILLWSSVLGYDRGRKDRLLIGNISRVVREGGLVIIDTNDGEYVFKKIEHQRETRFKYSSYSVRLVDYAEPPVSYTFFDVYEGKKLVYTDMWAIRLYTKEELVKLMAEFSFELLDSFSSIKGGKKPGPRIVLVFRKCNR